jgi:hypothetical protein
MSPHDVEDDEMLPEYDFSSAEVGKYYMAGDSRVMPIDSDLAEIFRDSAKINKALRIYLEEHGTPPVIEEEKAAAK